MTRGHPVGEESGGAVHHHLRQERLVFLRFSPFQYQGKPHLLLLVNDITERKRAEEGYVRVKNY